MFLVHLPTNHRFRPLYRFLGGLAGLYVALFGIVGLVEGSGHPFFARGRIVALGLHTNPAFAALSTAVGLVVVVSALVGHNVDLWVFLCAGAVFLIAGMGMLAVMQTDVNLLNFTVATCVVSFVVGLVMLTSGMYCQTASPEQARSARRREHTPPETLTKRTDPAEGADQAEPVTGRRSAH